MIGGPRLTSAAMATEESTPADQICDPCRGTGRLISGLGGEPHQIVCPWCEGSGHRIPGRDAQEHPAEGGTAPPSP
jgi:DnaJ-class molecular chaperone